MRRMIAILLLGVGAAPAWAAGLVTERVAILMRHGVRPPTKEPAMPAGFAADPWPRWTTKPGYLTPRGARAIELLGRADRAALARAGVIPARGCPASGAIALVSDSDQRTIATGNAWAAGFAPGCAIVNRHKPQDEPDPRFGAIEQGMVDYDPKAADAAVSAALPPGGLAAIEARERPNLARLDAILCGGAKASCGVTEAPSGLVPATAATRPKLSGALDRASTAAQILLLEYADGKPLGEVGWGRVTAADVTTLSSLHATEFAILARPHYVAARNLAPVAAILRAALEKPRHGAPVVTLIVGHDTNIANLGGVLGLHWRTAGFAADDPVPGGAILLTLLRDPQGRRFVRATYRAQPLDVLRMLAPTTESVDLHITGCRRQADHLCPARTFDNIIARSAALVN